MAEPQPVATGPYLDGSGTTAAVAVPAGTGAGLVAVVEIFVDGAAIAVTPPPGFQPAEGSPSQIAAGPGAHALHVFWRRLTGAETGPWVFSWAENRYREACATLWSDVVATGSPWDSPTATVQDLDSESATPPAAVTTLGPDRRLIWTATNWSGGAWTPPASPPGFVTRVQGGALVMTLADAPFPAAGSSGDVVGSCSGADKRCVWLGALIGTTGAAPGVSGELAATLPPLGGAVAGKVTVTGQADAVLPGLEAAVAATAAAVGSVNAGLPALGGGFVGAVRASGALEAALPPLTAAGSGAVAVRADLAIALPALSAALEGTAETADGQLEAVLPALHGSLHGAVRAEGGMAAALPPLAGHVDGRIRVTGAVAATLPAPTGALQGSVVSLTGTLAARLPALVATLTGTSAAEHPDVIMRVGAPVLGWSAGSAVLRWPAGAVKTRWPVGPPMLGGE